MISKLIYNKEKNKDSIDKGGETKSNDNNDTKTGASLSSLQQQSADAMQDRSQWTMNRTMYEYNNGNFSQSNFHNHVQNFMNTKVQIMIILVIIICPILNIIIQI